jgi:myo-inositol 2-dehydrogenase / D-chiro-inositol 1-dehydrogenase
VVLAACCDADPQRAAAFRERFNFQHAYTNYLEMLDAEHPQAVCLNVPPPLIAAMGVEIMKRGYPLMAEKPPGLNVADIDRLIAAADLSRVIHQVAFNRRYMPLITELKSRLASQTIHHIEGRMTRVHRTDPIFATTAVHLIDAARYIIGCDYQQVGLSFQELPEVGPGVANYRLDGRFTNGTGVHFSIFPLAGADVEQFILYATDRTYILDAFNGPETPGRLRIIEKGQLAADLDAYQLTGRREAYYLNGFYHEVAAFFDAVQAGAYLPHDFRSCRQSIEIMQCMIDRKTDCMSSSQ